MIADSFLVQDVGFGGSEVSGVKLSGLQTSRF